MIQVLPILMGRRSLWLAAVFLLFAACARPVAPVRRPPPRPVAHHPGPPPGWPPPPPVTHAPPPPNGPAAEALTTQNALRQSNGAAGLRWSAALQAEAQYHANGTRPSCRPGAHTQPKHQMLLKTLHSPIRASEVIRRWATKRDLLVLLVDRRYTEMACAETSCANGSQIWICLYR